MNRLIHLVLFLMGLGMAETALYAKDYAADRRRMVKKVEEMAASTASHTLIEQFDSRVIKAIGEVPRHQFVPAEIRAASYRNRPLSIGHGQTISQPFIVALMSELLQVKPTDRVLEIGTGSGYQTAVLSSLAAKVYSIEIIPELGEAARKTLERLGYLNVETKIGDGYLGWPDRAPFDGIIVTAAPDHIPAALVDQLKPNKRMVIPVGGLTQALMVVTKRADGTTTNKTSVPVRVVPLTRE